MSLAIKKFNYGGSSKVRTYKRGNDEVDLDAFIRQAEAGFNDWINRADIKEENKDEVRNAYRDIITRINDNPDSFVAKLGGGFINTAGITNKTEGFDNQGLAAGYLGDTLRGMSVYTKPESNKPKYKRQGRIITAEDQREILGDDFDSFIRLDDDSYDKNTGQRGLTKRLEYLRQKLEDFSKNYANNRDFDSDEDRQYAEQKLQAAISRLNNNDPNDDWFALSQLGFTNIDKYLSTGKETRTTPFSDEELSSNSSNRRAQQFEQFVHDKYPIYNGPLHDIINLTSSDDLPVSKETLNTFKNEFDKFSNDDLKEWIQQYIGNIDSYDINNNQFMRRIYRHERPNFNTGQIIATILNRMKKRGMLNKISQDSTKYYIPGTRMKGTGYVWDPEANTLEHVKIHEIPYWQEKIYNDFLSEYSSPEDYYTPNTYLSDKYPQIYSHRKGGVLKALEGAELQYPFLYTHLNNKINEYVNEHVNPRWIELQYGLGDDGKYRSPEEVLPGWEGERHDKRTARIGEDPQTPSISNAYKIQRHYINSGNMIGDVRAAYQNWLQANPSGSYQDFVDFYNNKVQAVRDLSRTKFDKGYNNAEFKSLYDDYNWLYSSSAKVKTPDISKGLLGSEPKLSDILGSTMFNRNALAFYDDNDSKDLRLGTFIDNDPSNTQFWINNEGKLELRTAQPEGDQKTEDQGQGEDQGSGAYLAELQTRLRNLRENNSQTKQKLWGEIGTNLLGAGRLAGSIQANNRMASTVRESLRPKLHNTYELYSPVTGAFSEMQLRNRQGADTLSQSYKPFTSDASLATARMFEGQKYSNDLQAQGFLADDKEIKRTQAEALKRQEDNIARRSALANENRDAIINNNQALAQLEASRVKQNWNSVDNYLQGVERRAWNRIDYEEALRRRKELEDEYDRREYEKIQDQRFNASQYQPELDTIDKLISEWEIANPTKSKERQSWYKKVSDRKAEIADRIREDNLYSMSQRRGWGETTHKYRKPGKYYDPSAYDWGTIIRRNGGTLKLSSNQLIDKVIRKNESNS